MMGMTSPRFLVRVASLALVLCWMGASAARAELMRYQYSGVVTDVHDLYGSLATALTTTGSTATFDRGVTVGQRITGTFAYDPAEQPNNTNPPPGEVSTNYGQIFGVGKPNSDELNVMIDGRTYLHQTNGLSVSAQPGSSAVGMVPTTDVLISNQYVSDSFNNGVSLSFQGGSQALYPPFGPPATLNLADFSRAELSAHGGWGDNSFQATIDSLTLINSTPEPATWLILGSAALAYLARRRSGHTGEV